MLSGRLTDNMAMKSSQTNSLSGRLPAPLRDQKGPFIGSFVVELPALIPRLTSQIHPQLAEDGIVHLGEDHGGMRLTALELCKLFQCELGSGIRRRADA